MTTKPLYVIISNGGDGSFYPFYTFNSELVAKLEAAANADLMDYENGIGCDGDGFHYDTIMVPVDSTLESLGISRVLRDNYADQFAPDDLEI